MDSSGRCESPTAALRIRIPAPYGACDVEVVDPKQGSGFAELEIQQTG